MCNSLRCHCNAIFAIAANRFNIHFPCIYISNLNISFSAVPHVLCRPDMVNFVLGHAGWLLSALTNQVPTHWQWKQRSQWLVVGCGQRNVIGYIHRLKWKCQQALRYGQTKLKTGHWLANFLLPLLDIHWHFLSNFKLRYSTALYTNIYIHKRACWPLPFAQIHPSEKVNRTIFESWMLAFSQLRVRLCICGKCV